MQQFVEFLIDSILISSIYVSCLGIQAFSLIFYVLQKNFIVSRSRIKTWQHFQLLNWKCLLRVEDGTQLIN
jgi:hypothetical protein